mgnify:CR=1 FL=1
MKKLGILGGGQLGRMMMPSIRSFGIEVSVLDPNPNAPCANLADNFVVGNFKDYQTVLNFGQTVDILTIEIEHVNVEALETLEKQGKIVRYALYNIRKDPQQKTDISEQNPKLFKSLKAKLDAAHETYKNQAVGWDGVNPIYP